MRSVHLVLTCAALLFSAGCQLFRGEPTRPTPEGRAPTTAPAGPTVKLATFDGSAQYGITIGYPADWKVVKDDSVLKAVSPDGKDNFFLYYQKLGFIDAHLATASLADSHYQDDRKKEWCADATATSDAPISVPDADARKIVMAGHKDGKPVTSMAAFMIRKGQVYVVTIECPQGDTAAASVFDQAVASIRWTN